MCLLDLINSTVNPYDTILVFDRNSSTLFNLNDFLRDCYIKDYRFGQVIKAKVKDLCVNGDMIQCEVIFND